ncbi:hypothetical protein GW765_00095, partial [Candidatus Parcubacteria bacterium]|nr:hypothetical protein [Candidatus Parcubacteria bacterium]
MSKKKLNLRFPVIEYDSVKKEFIWETVKSRRITKDILSSALSLLNLISEISDVDVEDLLKTGRERRFVYGRNIFIALMRKRYPEISYSDIGSFFEGETLNLSKDHASVIHGRRTHHQLLKKKIWYKERSQK